MQYSTYFLRLLPRYKHRAIENCELNWLCCRCIYLTFELVLEKRFDSLQRFLELQTIRTSITYTKQSCFTFPFTCLGVFYFRTFVWRRPADPADSRTRFVRRCRHISCLTYIIENIQYKYLYRSARKTPKKEDEHSTKD